MKRKLKYKQFDEIKIKESLLEQTVIPAQYVCEFGVKNTRVVIIIFLKISLFLQYF